MAKIIQQWYIDMITKTNPTPSKGPEDRQREPCKPHRKNSLGLFDCQGTELSFFQWNWFHLALLYCSMCLWLCVLKQLCSMFGFLLCICISSCMHSSLGLPPQHRGWLRLWEEGDGCKDCHRHLCPRLPNNCPAGQVQDYCGCCEQCANVEGQKCDPDGVQQFYGRCGEGLLCQKKIPKMDHRTEPEPTCVCQEKGSVCGSDGWTYPNMCQLREAASRHKTTLRLNGRGPCYSGFYTLFLQLLLIMW